MTDFVVKALEYGVLGLCAVTLLLVWRILQAEQKREGGMGSNLLLTNFCLYLLLEAFACVPLPHTYARNSQQQT